MKINDSGHTFCRLTRLGAKPWANKNNPAPRPVQGGAGFFYVPKLLSNELVGDRLGDVQGAVLDVVHTEEHGSNHYQC